MDPPQELYAPSPAVHPSKSASEVESKLLELIQETLAEISAQPACHDQTTRSSISSNQGSFASSQEYRPQSPFSVSALDSSSQSSLDSEDTTQPYDPNAEWQALRLQEHAKRHEPWTGSDLENVDENIMVDIDLSNEDEEFSAEELPAPESPKPAKRSRVNKSLVLRKLSLYCHMVPRVRARLEARRDKILSATNRTDKDDKNCWLVDEKSIKGNSQTVSLTISWTDFMSFGTNDPQFLVIQVGTLDMVLERTMTPEQLYGWVHDRWELSHVCGRWRCAFWLHHIMEPKAINLERVQCHAGRRHCEHWPKCLYRDEYGYPRPTPTPTSLEIKPAPKFYHKQERKGHGIREHQDRQPAASVQKPANNRKRKRDVASDDRQSQLESERPSKQRKDESSNQDMLAEVDSEHQIPNGEVVPDAIFETSRADHASKDETWEAQYGTKILDSSKRPRKTEPTFHTTSGKGKGAPSLADTAQRVVQRGGLVVQRLLRKLDQALEREASEWLDAYVP